MSGIADIARLFINGYNTFNFAPVAPHLHDDFQFQLFPASLGYPARTKSDFLEWVGGLEGRVKSLNLEIIDSIVAEDAVILHLRNLGEFTDGDPYRNEYIMIFKFKDGKIVAMKEFVDSAYTLSVMSKFTAKAETKE